MSPVMFQFPRGFLWGTATASHQVEGQNKNNNWHAWEQEEGHILHGHKSGLACDWWSGRWREDFDRAAESGQNAHRLSVEWSRIQPKPDRWDESALDRYREILIGLVERDMLPMVTLHHFTNPLWLEEIGGWENPQVVELFETFVRRTVEVLKGYTNMWVTINEPNVYAALAYFSDEFPPGKKDMNAAFAVTRNMVCAHAAAYHAIHEIQPEARVGLAHQYRGFIPAKSWSPLDKLVAGITSRLFNDAFPLAVSDGKLRYVYKSETISQAANTQDFLGINYYTQELVTFDRSQSDDLYSRRFYPADKQLSPGGFIANWPEGFFGDAIGETEAQMDAMFQRMRGPQDAR